MALTAVGFPGTVDAVQDAKRSKFQGAQYPVVGSRTDFAVTANGGATRTVDVAAGVAWAHGVMVTSDAVESVALDNVATAGQTRWDAIVLRRNWTGAGSVSVTKVNGTAALAAPMVVPTLNDDPGVLHDQLLAMVQITNGQTVPTSVDPRRAWGTKVFLFPSVAALPTASAALYGTEAVLATGARYRCLLDVSNNPAWISAGGEVTEVTGSGLATVGAGWAITASPPMAFRGLKQGVMRSVDVVVRRTGATITIGSTGNVTDQLVCTVVADYKPDYPVPVTFEHGSVPAWGTLETDGRLMLRFGTPGYTIPTQATTSLYSLRASFTFGKRA